MIHALAVIATLSAAAPEALTLQQVLDALAAREAQIAALDTILLDTTTVTTHLHGQLHVASQQVWHEGRYHETARRWGDGARPSDGAVRHVDRAAAPHDHYTGDGERYIHLAIPLEGEAYASITRTPDKVAELGAQRIADLRDALLGSFDTGPLSPLLHDTPGVRVHPKLVPLGAFQTVVIEADTTQGDLTIRLSPEHGYAVVAFDVTRRTGDLLKGKPIPERSSRTESFRFLDMQQVGDLWLPRTVKGTGTVNYQGRIQRVATEITVDAVRFDPPPDIEALLTVPPIPEGARVHFDDELNADGSAKVFRYRDGQMTPE